MLPNQIFIVDKRLNEENSKQFDFIDGYHPRTKQEQSFVYSKKASKFFQLIMWDPKHSSWFVDDQYVLPDGKLYILTPIHGNFLFLPSLWNLARTESVPWSKIVDDSLKNFSLDDFGVIEELQSICKVDRKKKTIQLDETKLFDWLRERISRLTPKLDSEEHAFDILCEYLPDEIIEKFSLYSLKKQSSIVPEKPNIPSRDEKSPSPTTIEHVKQILFNHFLDQTQSTVSKEFHKVQNKSDCYFAKRARCWYAPAWLENVSTEENCQRLLPSFILFCGFLKDISIDGYTIEIIHNQQTETIEDFARVFKNILQFLSDHDPAKRHCMNVPAERIGRSGWLFEFDRVTFFITTFTPHYSDTHPRYSHGYEKYCHILFQPEVSFLRHDLPDDTPQTNWTSPQTVRDKIRVAFRKNNREYPIRATIFYPPSHDMIRPLSNDLDELIEWWLL